MYHQKTGYAPGEPYATHSRRRYRLHPSRNPNHNGPNPDPTLWVVHYTQAEPNDRVPSNMVPIDIRMQQTLGIRQHLQAQGQIVQKDFMLHDRTNWPSIAFPRGRQGQQPAYGANAPPARIPQNMAYPTQPQPGPPAKRARPNPAGAAAATATSAVAVLDDDEEDTSRGDLFDHTTPREISQARYKQNHEWMEEILSAPYAINQIIPADLGLGVGGELASLTEGIFDAPVDPDRDVVKFNYVGRLDPGKAEEFRKRTAERIARENKEIERMKAKHAKRMARFEKGALVTLAEKQLRTAVTNPDDIGPEFWRLEGKIDDEDNEDGKVTTKTPAKVADIVAQVEASVGRHVQAVKELARIQDGGYEEAAAAPSPPPVIPSAQVTPPGSHAGSAHESTHSGVLVEDTDMDVGNSAAGLLDQFHTGLSSGATPGSNSFPTPQAHIQSAVGTPDLHVPSPAPITDQTPSAEALGANNDTKMSDGEDASNEAPPPDATGTGDWVVVPPGGISPGSTSAPQETISQPAFAPISNDSPAQHQQQQSSSTSTPSAPVPAIAEPSPAAAGTSSANTPGLPDFHTSPNDFADLGDLDTAGDALAGYGEDMSGDLGELEIDMDVGMDDSAFGDAFHGVASNTGAENEEGHADGGMGDGL